MSVVLTLIVCWRNLSILFLIVSSTSDLRRWRPVPGLTSAGSYLRHLCCDNAMNGSSHPTKTPKAGRTYCTLLFFLFLSFFHLALLSSAMATQEMNADKENPDGRKMEEEEEEEEGLNLQRRTRADLVRLCVRGEGGGGKMQSSRPRVRPNTKIYSSSDVCLSQRQRTRRPWNDLSLMLLLHRLISATLHSQLQQRMLGGQASSIYSQAVLEFQGSHGMSGKFRGYWGNSRQSFPSTTQIIKILWF